MIWISSAEHKLNTQFPIAPDLDTVTKQKCDLEVTLNLQFDELADLNSP